MLVANRGEIAVRIMRTLRREGIRSVAVHSDVDADAPHVHAADHAVRVGPAPAADSYLRVDRIVEAALETGAEAVHPGYGFLSEQPALPRACADAGLTWIGPPAEAIEAMGDKARARQLMRDAGVPVVPGTDDGDLDDAGLVAAAETLGYPVMVKPVAGGGGKGMTVADTADALRSALPSARRQARAAFGDDRLLLERSVTVPRHIEVQILADAHGRVIHLGERECSLQRRHQKIVEEAPSPLLDDDTRARICATAVDAAHACGYRNAGTVEFIVSGAEPDTFFFLEMNTRLQVEHPVTELVTGLDLVALQLRIAAGEPLPAAAVEAPTTGHAVEARVYAEDPARDFLPTGGTVLVYRAPAAEGVRVDSGVRTGTTVPTTYDPLLAKVIAHGRDRRTAIDRLRSALRDTTVLGMATNMGLLRRLLRDDDVAAGALDTGLVERRRGTLLPPTAPDHVLVAAALAMLRSLERSAGTGTFDRVDGWRLGAPAWTMRRLRSSTGSGHLVRWRGRSSAAQVAIDDDAPVDARAVDGTGGDDLVVELGGHTRRYVVGHVGDTVWIAHHGDVWALRVEQRLDVARTHDAHAGPVAAPMPGSVVAVAVRDGDAVTAGQTLVSIEAMKMEHHVAAPIDGTVARVTVAVGQQVEMEQLLAEIEPHP